MRRLRIAIGMVLWAAAIGGLGWLAWHSGGERQAAVSRDLWQYAVGERREVRFESEETLPVAKGDPVFTVSADGAAEQVGEVRRAGSDGAVLLYAAAPPLGPDARLSYYETPHSMEWVLQTMLPPEKQAEIVRLISEAFEAHQAEILAALEPILLDSLRSAMAVVEEDLPAALARHRPELAALGARYQEEIVRRELVPLVKQEIWPIVRRRAQPAAEEVGRELWQRASLWGFGWRYAYDNTPLVPKRNLFKQEWERYLEEEAAPVLESHTDEFVTIVGRIMADVWTSDEVRAALGKSFNRLLEDEELRQVVWSVMREVVVDNPRLHAVLKEHWTSERAVAAFRLAGSRLEPTVRKIGTLLLGDREQISPEFARVLRSQVLHKDQRWFVLEPAGRQADDERPPTVLPVYRGAGDPIYPFVPSAAFASSTPASPAG